MIVKSAIEHPSPNQHLPRDALGSPIFKVSDEAGMGNVEHGPGVVLVPYAILFVQRKCGVNV